MTLAFLSLSNEHSMSIMRVSDDPVIFKDKIIYISAQMCSVAK